MLLSKTAKQSNYASTQNTNDGTAVKIKEDIMTTTTTTRVLPVISASAAATGALVGGTVAAVRSTIAVNEGRITTGEAVKTVVQESAGTGLATAAGVAATAVLGLGGLAGLLGFTIAATGAKMLWDKTLPTPLDSKCNKKLQEAS